MRIGSGELAYEWNEHWVRVPATQSGRENGRTHAVAVAGNGDVIVFNQAQPGVLRFPPDGRLVNAWGDRFGGAHGMTLVVDPDGQEYLWLTDERSSEVVKTTTDGRTVLTIQRPDVPAYAAGRYVPTWVAVNEERFGGNGDVWVADGYGSNFVHRYRKDGGYVGSINGTEGRSGAFACPHAVAFDYRRGAPQLYVADRANRRVQVYDAEGKYVRAFGQDSLTHPCMFAFEPGTGRLFIPELFGWLAVVDAEDAFVGYVGANEAVKPTDGWPRLPGWPNLPADQIRPGHFNSPHGMTVAPNGDLYVVEWIVGGRITKLAKA
ncbi:MAG TPA: hypothetical protein VK324_18420 [Tepidisphaeraceae bacterium]|nr:hypothetical protein [Tepidisphaeraceae bacterium]